MPEDDPDAYGYIQRVLGTELRNLKTEIRRVHDILTHSCDLIAEDNGILPVRFRLE